MDSRPGLGVAFDSSTGFCLPNGATRSPDVAWIPSEKWDALTPQQRQKFLPLCPDFARDALVSLQEKMQEYLDNGMRLGWLINPQQQQVEIYRQGREKEVLDNPATVSGEDILPGFVLKCDRLW